ncbi:MAG: SRPBCC family protein, partial [Parahaliea sp.]
MSRVLRNFLLVTLLLVAVLVIAGLRPGQPIEVAVSTMVDVPHTRAWQLLRDLSAPHRYVPGLSATEFITAEHEGVGASRKVYQRGSDYLQETVIAWDEGHGFVLRLHRGGEAMKPFREAL